MKKRVSALLLAALMSFSFASAESIAKDPIEFEGTTLPVENTRVEIDPDGDGQSETVELRATFDTDSRNLTAVVTGADGTVARVAIEPNDDHDGSYHIYNIAGQADDAYFDVLPYSG